MPAGKHVNANKKMNVGAMILTVIAMIVAICGLSFVMREYVFSAYLVPSGSMEETIMTGDLVFTEKMSYLGSSPQRGDIVTFADPNDASEEPRTLIKRVIAVAGDTIDIRDGNVYLNGNKLDEPYTNGKKTYISSSAGISYPFTVPTGKLWVMGDNRSNSQDSRYIGAITVSSVTGRALFVYWPMNRICVLS